MYGHGKYTYLRRFLKRRMRGRHSRVLCGPGEGLGACKTRTNSGEISWCRKKGERGFAATPSLEMQRPAAVFSQPSKCSVIYVLTKIPDNLSNIHFLGAAIMKAGRNGEHHAMRMSQQRARKADRARFNTCSSSSHRFSHLSMPRA